MANNPIQNQNPNPENKKKVPQIPVSAFTTLGLTPRTCVFEMTRKDFEDAVLKVAKTFIPDFEECMYERGENNYNALVLWLPSNSSHLQNRDSIKGTILKEAPREYSQKMSEFIKRFCRDGYGPAITDTRYRYGTPIEMDRSSNTSKKMTAIAVNPLIFADLIFDAQGTGYAAVTGNYAITTTIHVETVFYKKDDKGSGIKGFRITKSMSNRGDGKLSTKYAIRG